ncbi:hypothetical protein T4B_7015 [Trichinella pseudospiralis]|uniref:Uncharacterized protein n=1 Tax=Trichinella pseudospiralis TaxID=6337 RepID=A0A0V1INE9_TRIPS|nr:hypothetical protein T4B_7015 [Trichinella pseudospiralis]
MKRAHSINFTVTLVRFGSIMQRRYSTCILIIKHNCVCFSDSKDFKISKKEQRKKFLNVK